MAVELENPEVKAQPENPPRPKRFGQDFAEAIKPFEEMIRKGAKPEDAADTPSDEPAIKPVEDFKKAAPKAEAKPEAKAEVKPEVDPDEEIMSGKRGAKAEDWRRVKASRDELKKQLDEAKAKAAKVDSYEKELTELKKRPVHNADLIAKIEKERDEYKAKHDAFIVQFTPEFQKKFDDQISSVVGQLKGSIPESEANKLADLLQLPDSEVKRKAIAEVTDGFDQFQIAEIVAANREVKRIQNERKEAMTKAQQTLQGIAEERQKQARESQERLGKTFEETIKKFVEGDDAIPVFKKKDGDENWNKAVEERQRVARVIFEGNYESDQDRVEAAAWAAAAPGILEGWKADTAAKDAEIAQLKEALGRLQSANPEIRTGGGGGKTQSGSMRGSFARGFREDMGG